MGTGLTIWKKLSNKRYREEFAVSMLKRMIPYQIRALRKKRGWSQAELASEAKLTQGVISRAEDPDYGNLTLTTIGRVAAGFDLAAIVKFVPFSELVRFSENQSESEIRNLPTFSEEERTSGIEGTIDLSETNALKEKLTKSASGATPRIFVRVYEETSGKKMRVRRESSQRRRGARRRVVPLPEPNQPERKQKGELDYAGTAATTTTGGYPAIN